MSDKYDDVARQVTPWTDDCCGKDHADQVAKAAEILRSSFPPDDGWYVGEKAQIEARKQRRRDVEFTFKGISTEFLKDKVRWLSRPTLEMTEILRRRGMEMIDGKIVPLPADELIPKEQP